MSCQFQCPQPREPENQEKKVLRVVFASELALRGTLAAEQKRRESKLSLWGALRHRRIKNQPISIYIPSWVADQCLNLSDVSASSFPPPSPLPFLNPVPHGAPRELAHSVGLFWSATFCFSVIIKLFTYLYRPTIPAENSRA